MNRSIPLLRHHRPLSFSAGSLLYSGPASLAAGQVDLSAVELGAHHVEARAERLQEVQVGHRQQVVAAEELWLRACSCR